MLEIRDLYASVDGNEILKGISLTVNKGEIHAIMVTDDSASDAADILGNLRIFSGVREFPVRVKCATLPWHTLKAALENKEVVSTE